MAPHLHIASQLLQVQFSIVSRSDTESGVCFILSSMVQKIAYRRIGLLSLCAASPMGEGLMDIPQLISILWQRYGTVFILIRHYVHAVKRQGSWLTPAQLLSLRGASGYVFREVSGLCSPRIRTRDLRIPSSLLSPCCHRGCML